MARSLVGVIVLAVLAVLAGGCAGTAVGVRRLQIPPEPWAWQALSQMTTAQIEALKQETSYAFARTLIDSDRHMELFSDPRTGEIRLRVGAQDRPDAEAIRALGEGVRDLAALARGGAKIESPSAPPPGPAPQAPAAPDPARR